MNKLNFLKPDKQNLSTYLYIGSFLFFIAVFDVFLTSFFKTNITSFLPNILSFLLPLILGTIGLQLIRIEFSGIKRLDYLNKNINSNWFNAILTLLVIFVLIKNIPSLLSQSRFINNKLIDQIQNHYLLINIIKFSTKSILKALFNYLFV